MCERERERERETVCVCVCVCVVCVCVCHIVCVSVVCYRACVSVRVAAGHDITSRPHVNLYLVKNNLCLSYLRKHCVAISKRKRLFYRAHISPHLTRIDLMSGTAVAVISGYLTNLTLRFSQPEQLQN